MSLINFDKLDPLSFHSLCNALVKAEFKGAICIEGAGGDEGIDCYVGTINGKGDLHVFQHKYLLKSLGPSGKKQIIESLKQVTIKHINLSQWTLLIPKNLTIDEINWFNTTLANKFSSVALEFWDSSKLRQLLTRHYRICYDYFGLPNHIEVQISNHKKDLNNIIIIPILAAIIDQKKDKIRSIMNEFLYQDFAAHHERDFDIKLKSLLQRHKNIDDKITEMYSKLSKELVKKLEQMGIRHRQRTDISYMENSIPIHDFMERLWKLIKTRSYDDSEFWIDEPDPEIKRIGFTQEPHSIIYECLSSQDCNEIRNKLVCVCNRLVKYIDRDLLIYEKLIEELNKESKILQIKLESILYNQRLRFIDMDNMSCESVSIW